MAERWQRLELKYLVSQDLAARVARDLEGICLRDRDRPYRVLSLYLDTPHLAFHRAKLRNDEVRYKLRARRYGTDGPVFLEVKHKVRDVIRKTRAAVHAATWPAAARGELVPEDAGPALEDFAARLLRTGAGPVLLVDYAREAFASAVDPYARVTFDRDLRAQITDGWSLDPGPGPWIPLDDPLLGDGLSSPVVLELKCATHVPGWMARLIQRHRLEHTSYSKYSTGMQLVLREARGLGPPADCTDLLEV